MKYTTIYVNDLAQLYFPKSSAKSAVNQLRRWIVTSKTLSQQLKKLHYVRYQRAFTPRQHQAIIEALGEP